MDGAITTTTDGPALASKPRRRSPRPLLFALIGLIALLGAARYGWDWYTNGRFIESTDDAYTQADSVAVAPRVSGYIVQALVADNERVQAGQVLARIDDRDYRNALAQARADIAEQEARIENLGAQLALQQSLIAEADAAVDAAKAALTFAEQDSARYAGLVRNGAASVQNAQQTESALRQRSAELARGRAAKAAADQQLAVLRTQQKQAEATLARARATADQAELNLSYTVVTAPIDGAVGDRGLRTGRLVQPGTRLMDIVPAGRDIYVVANFKETQLAQMWRGEHVEIEIDMLSGMVLHGTVDSLAPGTGAKFALLPPENATGNFTKIVQRVPVKILLDPPDEQTLNQLRPGLSVTASVDTRLPAGTKRRTLFER
jgi:membrane fusion protein (multidrug efflux system)